MNKIKEIVKRELKKKKKWQIFWMIFANVMILGVSIYQGDTWLGIAASITGVICVILCGMGKVSNYLFGTVNVVLYAIVAWKAKYYGDVMLNLLYYLPTNILGWVVWKKHLDECQKIDVHYQVMMNLDIITALVLDSILNG